MIMDNNRLDALFTGLTGGDETQKPEKETSIPSVTRDKKPKEGHIRAKQKKLEKETNTARFCTIVNAALLKKVRIIAKREGLQIKDVVEAAFSKAINNYERKHGKIEEDPKKNLKDLF